MRTTRFLAAVAAAAAVWWSCATEKKQTEATTEIIYEEAVDAGPKDPFEGCKAAAQEGNAMVATLTCGSSISGAFIQARTRGPLSEAAIDKQLSGIETQAQFPADATRERFTEQYSEYTGHGTRIYQDTPVSKFDSQNVLVQVSPTTIRIVSCTNRFAADPTRCKEIIPELVANGIPERVPGAPPPPVIEVESDGGTDGGMEMDGGTSAEGGTDAGTDAGTRTKRRGTRR